MKILIAIDGSPCSQLTVQEVSLRPWPQGSEVRIVTVDSPYRRTSLGSPESSAFDEVVRVQRAELFKHLSDAQVAFSKNAPSLNVTTELLEGNPKEEIVAIAERWGADLICLGSHGYGPVRRFFLGSVSQFVAQYAPCSVQIVRCAEKAQTAVGP
ncbi:universal stress protein [Planctomicrobium sp. SH527]|uniref:universal stress protein n=1 Tax=Planctomicrobium sp. SH527 TaxID=3448123 RepID=UPI003F5C1E39